MIDRIVVSSGNRRTVVALPTDKPSRHLLGNKLKAALFPSDRDYRAAHAAGHAAQRERQN